MWGWGIIIRLNKLECKHIDLSSYFLVLTNIPPYPRISEIITT